MGICAYSVKTTLAELMLNKKSWLAIYILIHLKVVQCCWGQGSVQATGIPPH